MKQIPDAPWIRDAERRGTDSMYDWVYGVDDKDGDNEPWGVYEGNDKD